jgi:hypothetical protein
MTSTRCRNCTAPLPPPPPTGRPPSYCSTECRRAAEFAIRRCNKRLEQVEAELSEARVDQAFAKEGDESAQRRVDAWQAEADVLSERLRGLMADDDEKETP